MYKLLHCHRHHLPAIVTFHLLRLTCLHQGRVYLLINDTTQKTPVTLSAQGGRRRAKPRDNIDTEIVNSLNSLNDLQRPEPEPDSSDTLFCKSLVRSLQV